MRSNGTAIALRALLFKTVPNGAPLRSVNDTAVVTACICEGRIAKMPGVSVSTMAAAMAKKPARVGRIQKGFTNLKCFSAAAWKVRGCAVV